MGVGWTVELKLNRKKREQNGSQGGGGCDPLPPQVRHCFNATVRKRMLSYYDLVTSLTRYDIHFVLTIFW